MSVVLLRRYSSMENFVFGKEQRNGIIIPARILIFYSRGEMKPIEQHRGEAQ